MIHFFVLLLLFLKVVLKESCSPSWKTSDQRQRAAIVLPFLSNHSGLIKVYQVKFCLLENKDCKP